MFHFQQNKLLRALTHHNLKPRKKIFVKLDVIKLAPFLPRLAFFFLQGLRKCWAQNWILLLSHSPQCDACCRQNWAFVSLIPRNCTLPQGSPRLPLHQNSSRNFSSLLAHISYIMAPRRQQPLALVIPQARIWPPHKTNWHPLLQKFYNKCMSESTLAVLWNTARRHRPKTGPRGTLEPPSQASAGWRRWLPTRDDTQTLQSPKTPCTTSLSQSPIHYAQPLFGRVRSQSLRGEISRPHRTDAKPQWRNQPRLLLLIFSFISTFGEKSRLGNSSRT